MAVAVCVSLITTIGICPLSSSPGHLSGQPAHAGPSGFNPQIASIPGGYLIIDNRNSQPENGVLGSAPILDNVFANPLELGSGVQLDRATMMFSLNVASSAVKAWQSFPHLPPLQGQLWSAKTDPLLRLCTNNTWTAYGHPAWYWTNGMGLYASSSPVPSTNSYQMPRFNNIWDVEEAMSRNRIPIDSTTASLIFTICRDFLAHTPNGQFTIPPSSGLYLTLNPMNIPTTGILNYQATQGQAGYIPYTGLDMYLSFSSWWYGWYAWYGNRMESYRGRPMGLAECYDFMFDPALVLDAECQQMIDPNPSFAGGLDPFDAGLHPQALQTAMNSWNIHPTQLVASEIAKADILGLYNQSWQVSPHQASMEFSSIFPTGLRLYPNVGAGSWGLTPNLQGNPALAYAPSPSFAWGAYPPQHHASNWWSNPTNTCQITRDGTIHDLMHQVDPSDGAYNNILNTCLTRVLQMGPVGMDQATLKSKLDSLLRSTSISLDQVKFLYIDQKSTNMFGLKTPTLTITDKLPFMANAWSSGNPTIYPASGVPNAYADVANLNSELSHLASLQKYPAISWNSNPVAPIPQVDGFWKLFNQTGLTLTDSIINPPYEFNIHDHCFTQWGGHCGSAVSAAATDTVAYQKDSGAYGLLGTLKFQESVSGYGQWWAPN